MQPTSKWRAWLYAFRLRTLPLAFSSIFTGTAVAHFLDKKIDILVFVLSLLTTLLLQILSNLANDFGDSEKGTDNHERIGPKRAIQSGILSFQEIKTGIFVSAFLALVSGVSLIYFSFRNAEWHFAVLFLILGILAIAAAIKYTVGKNAYGYFGLGDLFVLLFFGLVGVGGSFFLQSKLWLPAVLLPSLSIGFFSCGVLNLNNMRDRLSDQNAGKITLAVSLGEYNSKIYQALLILGGWVSITLFACLHFSQWKQFLFFISLPLFLKIMFDVFSINEPKDFDPYLKKLAIATFFFSILIFVGSIS